MSLDGVQPNLYTHRDVHTCFRMACGPTYTHTGMCTHVSGWRAAQPIHTQGCTHMFQDGMQPDLYTHRDVHTCFRMACSPTYTHTGMYTHVSGWCADQPIHTQGCTHMFQDGVQTNTANTEGSQGPQDMQDTPDALDAEDTKDSLLTIPSQDDVDDVLDNSPSERPSVDVHSARGQGLKRNSSGMQTGLPLLAQLQADGRPGANGKKRKEDISSKSFLNTLNDYLRDYIDREERRRAEEMRRSEEAEREHAPNMLWARNLAQQIEEIRDEKKRKLLKLKIVQMVNECQMEELQNE